MAPPLATLKCYERKKLMHPMKIYLVASSLLFGFGAKFGSCNEKSSKSPRIRLR